MDDKPVKTVTLPDFLTQGQIALAAQLYATFEFDAAVAQILTQVIEPNLTAIDVKLGQENDARYLAYAVVHVLSQARKALRS